MSKISILKSQHPADLIGLVLCGGESKRMGSDKGLLLKSNIPWAVIVASEIEKLNIPVYISVNSSQINFYESHFRKEQLIVDSVNSEGPLTGLSSAHQAFPDKDVLLVACDMIEIKQETLLHLMAEYLNNTDFDFFAFDNAGIKEPLCAIYTYKAVLKIIGDPERNSKYIGSLRRILDAGNTRKLTPTDNSSFKNYNRKSGLKP